MNILMTEDAKHTCLNPTQKKYFYNLGYAAAKPVFEAIIQRFDELNEISGEEEFAIKGFIDCLLEAAHSGSIDENFTEFMGYMTSEIQSRQL